MKKFLVSLALFLSLHTHAMTTVLRQASKANPKNQQLSLNAPRNFGTTHFIRGYKHTPSATYQAVPVSTHQPAPIINKSSAHLIDPTCHTQVFFPSIHHITSIIIDIIKKAQDSITIAIYSLTEKNIAHELIAAHKRGIKVCIF